MLIIPALGGNSGNNRITGCWWPRGCNYRAMDSVLIWYVHLTVFVHQACNKKSHSRPCLISQPIQIQGQFLTRISFKSLELQMEDSYMVRRSFLSVKQDWPSERGYEVRNYGFLLSVVFFACKLVEKTSPGGTRPFSRLLRLVRYARPDFRTLCPLPER